MGSDPCKVIRDELWQRKIDSVQERRRIAKLEDALRLIISCAGVPSAVDALHNVVAAARDALEEEKCRS